VSLDDLLEGVTKVVDAYLRSLNDSSITQRGLVSPVPLVIHDVDYLRFTDFVGTAHFSRRSISDALTAVRTTEPIGICLELCPFRYEYLKTVQDNPLERGLSSLKSEFVATIELLGDKDVDVWLIDMNQEEVAARILALASVEEARAWNRIQGHLSAMEEVGLRLWEEGLKDEAITVFNGDVALMRKAFPTLWKVLILERNVFMACRLIYLIVQYLERGFTEFKILVFVGAAHVDGIKQLLTHPTKAFHALEHLGIYFTKPHAVKID
jgi:pheromone shutdown protein TraB